MARLIFLLFLFLTGCAATSTANIAYCPPATFIERPTLDVTRLKDGDGPDIVIGAHRSSIRQLQKYSIELVTILKGYQ